MLSKYSSLEPVHSVVLLHPEESDPVAGTEPSRVSIFVTKATNFATVNPAVLQFKNPVFRPPLLQFHPRSFFDLPTVVAPDPNPSEDTLFQAPRNPGQQFFLPHYRIAAMPQSGAQWVSFETIGASFRLTVHLTELTPAALSQGHERLQSQTRYLITASLRGRDVNWDLVLSAPDPGGAITLTLDVPDTGGLDLLYTAMTEDDAKAKLILRRSLSVAFPVGTPASGGEQQYSSTNLSVDSVLPFTFNKDLNKNIFAGLHTTIGPVPAWNMLSVNWKGRAYRYYQSTNQPTQVYFLPDAFKVQRQQELPHRPALAVSAKGNDMASMQMTLSYLACPVWDPQRIIAAMPELQAILGLSELPKLALFQATDAKLFIHLPGADSASGDALVEQITTLIDLTAGIQGSFTLPVQQFREVYDALFDDRSAILSGEVRVKVDADTTAVPFVARISDMNVDVLAQEKVVDTQKNRMLVAFRNTIESAVRITSLRGVISRNGEIIASSMTATWPAMPAELKPAVGAASSDQVVVELSPSTGAVVGKSITDIIGGVVTGKDAGKEVTGAVGGLTSQILDSSCEPLFDFSGVSVLSDPQAVWRAIMRDQPIVSITRRVDIKLVAASLGKASTSQVMAVQIVFDNGQTVSFDASQAPDSAGFLSQSLILSTSLDSYILGVSRADTYTYRLEIVSPDGIHQGDWITDNRDTLFIVPRLK